MFDMTDFLKGFGSSANLGKLGQQYGLSPDQMQRTLEATLPAFAAVMQRQLSDPAAMANWAKMVSAMAPGGLPFGLPSAPEPQSEMAKATSDAMGKLFGSPEVANAVAKQIAASSGVGQAVMNSMMPMMAAMMVSAITAANAKPGTDFNDLAKTLQPVTSKLPNPIGPNSPFDETIGEFIRGFNRGRPEPQPEPERSDVEVMLSQIVAAGKQAQAAHAQAIEDILDRMMGRKG